MNKYYAPDNYIYSFPSMTTYVFPVWQTYFFSSFMPRTFEIVNTCVPIQNTNGQNNNNGPLTAVLSVSMTVIPNFPCFYRWVLWVWCHLWPHQGRSTCAKLPGFWLVSLYLPCGSHDHCLFWMTLIGQSWSYHQNKAPWQFSTVLSSSGGIFCKKSWLFFMKIVWKIILGHHSALLQ